MLKLPDENFDFDEVPMFENFPHIRTIPYVVVWLNNNISDKKK